jgi:hypothetical protein
MTRAEYVAELKAAGHFRGAIITKANGTGFYGACECGYQSTTKRTQALAIESVEHHRKLELAAVRANGGGRVSVPRSVGPGL